MTIVQQNSRFIDGSSRSLKCLTNAVGKEDSFKSALDSAVLADEVSVADPQNDDALSLGSEIRIPHSDLLKAFDGSADADIVAALSTLQNLPVNLLQQPSVDVSSEIGEGIMGDISRVKKSTNDGTELDISMLLPSIAPELKPIKVEVVDEETTSDVSIAGVNASPDLNQSMLSVDSASFVLSSDFEILDAVYDVNLLNQNHGLSKVGLQLPNSALEESSDLDVFDALTDEVPIVSVKVTSNAPDAKLGQDASMTGESDDDLADVQSPATDVTPVENNDFNPEFDPTHASSTTEVLGMSGDGKDIMSEPSQQVQRAIFAEKNGVGSGESKTLSIVLNPEELGGVNVQLTSDAEGKMKAVLTVEKQETLSLLQHDLHQLKTILKEIGIDDSGVSLQLASNADQGHQQHESEYVSWDDRELMLARHQQASGTTAVEKAHYTKSSSSRRLDIQA